MIETVFDNVGRVCDRSRVALNIILSDAHLVGGLDVSIQVGASITSHGG